VGFVVEQDPPRRRVHIVELPGPHDPDEGGDRPHGDPEPARDDGIQQGPTVSLNARDRSELASTVSELSGITAAAINGWTSPVTASVPAARL